MARPGSLAAVACAGAAVLAAGLLLTTPLPELESPRLFQLAEHITLQRGVVSVNLSGPWDTLDEDVRMLQRTRRIKRIVIDVMFAPAATEKLAWSEYVPYVQQALPHCEVYVWTGEW